MRLRKRKSLVITAGSLICICVFAAAQTSANRSKPKTPAKIDPCALLSSDEILAVQGEAVEESKSTIQPSGSITFQQCTFRTTTPSKSVSLAVATAGTQQGSASSPRRFWRQQFYSQRDHGEVEGSKAQLISGLGDEAFWVNNPVTGALYVLRGDTFFRISVGGARQSVERLARSKALAAKTLDRLMRALPVRVLKQ